MSVAQQNGYYATATLLRTTTQVRYQAPPAGSNHTRTLVIREVTRYYRPTAQLPANGVIDVNFNFIQAHVVTETTSHWEF